MPVVVTQVITQVQRIFKNGRTCVKWPLKGGFLQVWPNMGQQAGKWPYLRDVNTIKPAKKP